MTSKRKQTMSAALDFARCRALNDGLPSTHRDNLPVHHALFTAQRGQRGVDVRIGR
ncbi:MAG TPA: hypothetical protein VG796_14860 [Verrucomicrobiales bacterium]|nr:hypothetical protein [Verrucomicrobiales bacterium]